MSTAVLRAPFPYFGGKRRAASLVWGALGNVDHYVEPSAAVLLARPHAPRCETINDLDGMVANFWPVIEADLHARHLWLVGQREGLTARLIADPEWCDPKIAGWWCWGACAWIGDGWCDAKPSRKLPFFGNTGIGVHSAAGAAWKPLATRLRDVDVASGDWTRVVSATVLKRASGICGVYLDPPYLEGAQQYAAGGTGTGLSAAVREWCEATGDDKRVRVVLSGYAGEHDALESRGWRVVEWRSGGAGYMAAGADRTASRERLWLSPHCLGDESLPLFGGGAR